MGKESIVSGGIATDGPGRVGRLSRACLGIALGTCLSGMGLSGMATAGSSQAERVWRDTLTNESSFFYTVSIGNRGTQVFSDTGIFSQKTRLYSAFDDDGDPAWVRSVGTTSYNRVVASAADADVHALWRQEDGPGSEQVARAYIFRSSSSTPIGTFTFDQTEQDGGGLGACFVSADGRWVVAMTRKSLSIQIARFDTLSSNPGNPVTDITVSRFGTTTAFDCSADGKRVYLGGEISGTIVDLTSGATLLDEIFFFGPGARSHALSGDGRTAMIVGDEETVVFRQSGNQFIETRIFDPFGSNEDADPKAAALSYDGRVGVAGFSVRPQLLNSHVFAWNTLTGQQLFHHSEQGGGYLQNAISAMDVSDSGNRIVVGFQGDLSGLTREIQVFEANSQGTNYNALASFAQSGSVYDLDLSADGKHLAVNSRSTHISSGTGTQIIDSYDLGTDFRANGNPREDAWIEFEYRPENGATRGFLLIHDQLATTNFSFGTLHLSRQGLRLVPMGPPNVGTGVITHDYHITDDRGTTKYFQAYGLGPRQLSESWMPVTVLP